MKGGFDNVIWEILKVEQLTACISVNLKCNHDHNSPAYVVIMISN